MRKHRRTGRLARFLCISILLVALATLIPAMFTNAIPNPLMAKPYAIRAPSALYSVAANYGDLGHPPLSEKLRVLDNSIFPTSTDPGVLKYISCWGFTSNDYDEDYWPNQWTLMGINASSDVRIGDVYLVVVASDMYPVNNGRFSFCTDFPHTGDYLASPHGEGTWTFSQYWGFHSSDYGNYTTYWDITSYRNWTLSMLTADFSFRVMWDYYNNASGQYFDYVGIEFSFGTDFDNTIPIPQAENNMYNLIWMLVLFMPALALGGVYQEMGFVAGMFLMLIVLGFSTSGFLPVALIGLCSMGIVLYKKG